MVESTPDIPPEPAGEPESAASESAGAAGEAESGAAEPGPVASSGGVDLPPRRRRAGPADLPPYCRSLLRVRVPVIVTLAQKRQPLGRILELGPGSLIQFDKSCEEMLDLDVAHHRVATGEAVKVGDKFGLRITSLILPEERFCPMKPAKAKP